MEEIEKKPKCLRSKTHFFAAWLDVSNFIFRCCVILDVFALPYSWIEFVNTWRVCVWLCVVNEIFATNQKHHILCDLSVRVHASSFLHRNDIANIWKRFFMFDFFAVCLLPSHSIMSVGCLLSFWQNTERTRRKFAEIEIIFFCTTFIRNTRKYQLVTDSEIYSSQIFRVEICLCWVTRKCERWDNENFSANDFKLLIQ